ncbi:D-ribose pyranase [Sporosarcina sp. P21c]|uniref:D-ribose pyranase n=1 Tax=unclassified Sporosarcina TaxID=2647733 RepID=UPI000C1657AC|nr:MULTISPECIES: D-ribose pyranase [unclassified Sporosarcina]PIC68074.1 D-ribose pyranase [Sporosarcina sp. P16a]PIC90999.1 D-ribose pyranase [Sporosarcina sp. P21c]PIC94383.1 D-ribose pyranase [Sporosarcina sp. P25]
MKKHGMINREIAAMLAKMGHTDQLTIADCGLPIPEGVPCIDLSYAVGKPGFTEILLELMKDFQAEKVYIASQIKAENPTVYNEITQLQCPIDELTHDQLKEQSRQSKFIIRTGEATPYANIIVQSGVIF